MPDSMRFALGGTAAFTVVALVATRFAGPVGMLLFGGALVCLVIGLLGTSTTPRPTATVKPAGVRTVPAPEPSRRELWERARRRHDEVLSEYGEYELNPEMLLKYPAMWDLSNEKVIAFHDALDHAGALRGEAFPGDDASQAYIKAVTDLRTSWYSADRYARSTGVSGLPDEDVRDLERGLKLYRHADASTSTEQAAYLNQVVGTVDRLVERGVFRTPPPFRAELEARARKAIEG